MFLKGRHDIKMGASSILNAFRRHVLGRREEETCSLPLIPRSENYSEQQLVVHLANHKQPLRLEYRPEQTVRVSNNTTTRLFYKKNEPSTSF